MKKSSKSNIAIVHDYLNGVRPVLQVGYTGKNYTKRKVGETWEEPKGTFWIQRKSGPATINKQADIIREASKQICKCGQNIKWGNSRDVLFYNKTKMCENCLIDFETKLRILGFFNIYEKYKIVSNKLGLMLDFKEKIKDSIKFFKSDNGEIQLLCNGEGFLEKFTNTNTEKLLENAKNDLVELNKLIKSTTKEKNIAKKEYNAKLKEFKMTSYAK